MYIMLALSNLAGRWLAQLAVELFAQHQRFDLVKFSGKSVSRVVGSDRILQSKELLL